MKATQRRRRRRRAAVATLACATLVNAAVSCTSTVTPPPAVRDPVTVFLLREALHTGIVLPGLQAADPYVEFGFGDWAWFALAEDAWYDAFATVLWPTHGTLGRREFPAWSASAMADAAPWAELQPMLIERERATTLRARLQQAFDAGIERRVRRPELRFEFVPFARSYWFADNCADLAAEWLVALGCEVTWRPVRLRLSVAGT